MGRPKGSRNAPRTTLKLATPKAPVAKAAHLAVAETPFVKPESLVDLSHEPILQVEDVTAFQEAREREIASATLKAEDLKAVEDAANQLNVATLKETAERPLFERNETGVICLSSAAESYKHLTIEEPVIAVIDGDEVLLLPSGFVLMHHPEGNASCTANGRAYTYGTEGAVLVPEELEDALTTHGFKRRL